MILAVVGAGTWQPASSNDTAQEQPQKANPPLIKKRTFLAGHTGSYVRSLAFSPDGKTLASGGDDATVRLWDLATGKEKAVLRGHTDQIWQVAFLPDGKTLASRSDDATVRLWDLSTGEQKALVGGSKRATISPDGNTVAVVKKRESVRLLDLASRQERRRIPGNWTAVEFSADAKNVALVSGARIEIWGLADHKRKAVIQVGSIHESLAFSNDNKTLAVGICDGAGNEEVRLYDVATGKLNATLKSPTAHILSLAFSPDDRYLAVGRYLEEMQLWDLKTVKALRPDSPPADDVADDTQLCSSLRFSPDGKILAAGGTSTDGRDKGIVRLWDIAQTIRVAGIVLKWIRTDKEANYRRVEPMIREAAGKGAKIVCTTECFLDGYAIADKSIPLDDYRALGEPIPNGKYCRRLMALARELKIHLVAGMLEADGEARYNTAILIGPDGGLAGKYRKQKLGHESVRNTAGDVSLVFKTPHGRAGLMICADRTDAEIVRRFSDKQAEFLLCPSGGMFGPKTNDPIVQARSRENKIPIVFVHPAEFLVTGPDGSILERVLLGDRLLVLPDEVDGAKDSKRICYYDLPVSATKDH